MSAKESESLLHHYQPKLFGGVISSTLHEQFRSPTIGLFIEGEHFVKLVENLPYYMSVSAEPLVECYVDPIVPTIRYPKIKVGDIEICCQHYQSCADAIQAWERRRARVNLDAVYVIANSWNLQENSEYMERLLKTGYNTVIFTSGKIQCSRGIALPEQLFAKDIRGMVRPNLTDRISDSPYRYYEKAFDAVAWLNHDGLPIEKLKRKGLERMCSRAKRAPQP